MLQLHKIFLKLFLQSYFQRLEPILWAVISWANPLPLRINSILETAWSLIWWNKVYKNSLNTFNFTMERVKCNSYYSALKLFFNVYTIPRYDWAYYKHKKNYLRMQISHMMSFSWEVYPMYIESTIFWKKFYMNLDRRFSYHSLLVLSSSLHDVGMCLQITFFQIPPPPAPCHGFVIVCKTLLLTFLHGSY